VEQLRLTASPIEHGSIDGGTGSRGAARCADWIMVSIPVPHV